MASTADQSPSAGEAVKEPDYRDNVALLRLVDARADEDQNGSSNSPSAFAILAVVAALLVEGEVPISKEVVYSSVGMRVERWKSLP